LSKARIVGKDAYKLVELRAGGALPQLDFIAQVNA
jgi:hypothetical protein